MTRDRMSASKTAIHECSPKSAAEDKAPRSKLRSILRNSRKPQPSFAKAMEGSPRLHTTQQATGCSAKENQPSYLCVSGSPEFHRQAFWRHIEEAGHAVCRFTEDRKTPET